MPLAHDVKQHDIHGDHDEKHCKVAYRDCRKFIILIFFLLLLICLESQSILNHYVNDDGKGKSDGRILAAEYPFVEGVSIRRFCSSLLVSLPETKSDL